MERPQIDEVGGWITITKAMEMLGGVSRARIMDRIRRGQIFTGMWEDRLMLRKSDVEIIAAKPRQSGRPRTRPITDK